MNTITKSARLFLMETRRDMVPRYKYIARHVGYSLIGLGEQIWQLIKDVATLIGATFFMLLIPFAFVIGMVRSIATKKQRENTEVYWQKYQKYGDDYGVYAEKETDLENN